jgi:hypothetical protein
MREIDHSQVKYQLSSIKMSKSKNNEIYKFINAKCKCNFNGLQNSISEVKKYHHSNRSFSIFRIKAMPK